MSAFGRKQTFGLSLKGCSLTAALEKKADVRNEPSGAISTTGVGSIDTGESIMNAQMQRRLMPLNVPRAMGCSGIILCLVIVSTVSFEGVAQVSDDFVAAEQGFAQAQYNLRLLYFRAQVSDDFVASLRVAAEQGDTEAQFNLGVAYDVGEDIEQDHAEAAKWYRMAAEQGFAQAQYNVGWMYANGQGVAQDYGEAVRWYRMAAELGFVEAQYNVGWMYVAGQGVAQDYGEAVRWYRLAAEQGDAHAQYNLGLLYFRGQGVAQDYVEAYALITTSVALGRALSEEGRYAVLIEMTPSQVERGEELAREYREKYFTR